MRAADRWLAREGCSGWSPERWEVWAERVSEGGGGVQNKHNSDNRGVWVINDPGAGSL